MQGGEFLFSFCSTVSQIPAANRKHLVMHSLDISFVFVTVATFLILVSTQIHLFKWLYKYFTRDETRQKGACCDIDGEFFRLEESTNDKKGK